MRIALALEASSRTDGFDWLSRDRQDLFDALQTKYDVLRDPTEWMGRKFDDLSDFFHVNRQAFSDQIRDAVDKCRALVDRQKAYHHQVAKRLRLVKKGRVLQTQARQCDRSSVWILSLSTDTDEDVAEEDSAE